jgi:DNA polymerase I-like protein with 3'-5' exonuclease and polymerase domains
MIVADFETEAIQNRPHYPPRPVGIAISYADGTSEYLAWGHPSSNNIDEESAKRRVRDLLQQHESVWHNAKFDLEVAQKWCGYMPSWERWHDTMLLAFLDNPHSKTLALKELASDILGIPPIERDEVRDWILTNVPGARRAKAKWGAHISKAPGDLVGRYAKGDVLRTRQLFDTLYPRIKQEGMLRAYDRERKLIPILIDNEQRGINCDLVNLKRHETECTKDFERVDAWIAEYLGAPGLNLDEDDALADALEKAGKVTEWVRTETGARSTSKTALDKMLTDRLLYAALMYRGSMATCLRTFMRPWIELAESNSGRLYTTWNTTKQEEGGGTRTGRLSSSNPLNLQNIPNDFEERLGPLFEQTRALDVIGLGPLPTMRDYIIADSRDHLLVGFDFSSQEPRTAAHFEDGRMLAAYKENPARDIYLDMIEWVKEDAGITITRKHAKACLLGLLYGMGIGKLAVQLGCSVEEAQSIKAAFLRAMPDIRAMIRAVQTTLQRGDKITTWGGRRYAVEPPTITKTGQLRTYDYKGPNVLVQGSAADETKEALVRYVAQAQDARLLLQVHDEIVICVHKDAVQREARKLHSCMVGLELDVPMLAEGEVGYRWGQMAPLDLEMP